MGKKFILDSLVQQAVVRPELVDHLGLGKPERRIDNGSRENSKIIYTFGDTIAVVGYCRVSIGIPKQENDLGIITEEEENKYKRRLDIYKQETPKGVEATLVGQFDFVTRGLDPRIPQSEAQSELSSEKGSHAKYGVLVASKEDAEWHTAQLRHVVIQYVHPDAIMNIKRYQERTDLTGSVLVKVMSDLRTRYQIGLAYLNGEACDQIREDQDTVFEAKLKGEVTAVGIGLEIRKVYGAGNGFRTGIAKLEQEKIRRIEEEERRVRSYF